MTTKELVDQGWELRAQIKKFQDLLDEVEEKLIERALKGEQVDLADPDREGKRFLAQGSELVVPVIFTSDLLVKSFQNGSPQHQRVEAASRGRLGSFFSRVTTFQTLHKDGKQFRKVASELLGEHGPAFVSACVQVDKHGVPKSDVKIAWSEAEPVAA